MGNAKQLPVNTMDQKHINRALLFAAQHFITSCHNTGKPVYLHSLRVAQHAAALGCDDFPLVCAVFHDLLEDTACTEEDIAAAFGTQTAACVKALTFDAAIPDKLKKNTLSIDACADFGPAALIIKCLDTMDNMDYFALASEKDQAYLLKKYDYLKAACEAHIPLEPVYIAYKTKLDTLLQGLHA